MSNVVTLPGKATQTELSLPKGLSEAEWKKVGEQLKGAGGSLMWWLGDWWAYGEEQAIKYSTRKEFVQKWENGYSYQTCVQAGSVAKAVPSNNRLLLVPWAWHRDVAKLDPAQQKRALAWAEKERELNKKRKPKDKVNEADFKYYIKKYILKEKTADDDEEELEKETPEQADSRRFMAMVQDTLIATREVKGLKLKKDRLQDMLKSAQKAAAAWDNVIKDIEQRLGKKS